MTFPIADARFSLMSNTEKLPWNQRRIETNAGSILLTFNKADSSWTATDGTVFCPEANGPRDRFGVYKGRWLVNGQRFGKVGDGLTNLDSVVKSYFSHAYGGKRS